MKWVRIDEIWYEALFSGSRTQGRVVEQPAVQAPEHLVAQEPERRHAD